MKNKENLSIEEVARLLDLPLVTIQRWEHQGKIPIRIVKHKKCFRRRDILEWAADHGFTIKTEASEETHGPGDILHPAIKRAGIFYDLPGKDIVEVFENAVSTLPFLPRSAHEMTLHELLNREEMASTGIGQGIAIPHTRERLQISTEHIYIPILFLKNKIEFNAIDGNPVFVLFMIFTSNTKEHLNVLSHISQALKDQELLTIINEKNKNNNLLNRIKKIERKFRT